MSLVVTFWVENSSLSGDHHITKKMASLEGRLLTTEVSPLPKLLPPQTPLPNAIKSIPILSFAE